MKIFAIDKTTNEREEITDLYWFQEQGVHNLNGDAFHTQYTFEFHIERTDAMLPSAATVEIIVPSVRSK